MSTKYITRTLVRTTNINDSEKSKPKYFYQWTTDTGKRVNSIELTKIAQKIPLGRVPPAYPFAQINLTGKDLLAKCRDDKDRLQYIYYQEAQKKKNFVKYCKLLSPLHRLQKLIGFINKTSTNDENDEDKVISLIILLMSTCHFRIGNEKFEKKYNSYGITTLHRDHFKFGQKDLLIKFKGKKGVENKCKIRSTNSLYHQLQEQYNISKNSGLPYVFTLKDKKITSRDVNKFLQEKIGINSKDLRTYFANILFINEVRNDLNICKFETLSQTARKRVIREKIEKVADKLHHTVAICKNSYIFPSIIDDLEAGGHTFRKILITKPSSIDIFTQYLTLNCSRANLKNF